MPNVSSIASKTGGGLFYFLLISFDYSSKKLKESRKGCLNGKQFLLFK